MVGDPDVAGKAGGMNVVMGPLLGRSAWARLCCCWVGDEKDVSSVGVETKCAIPLPRGSVDMPEDIIWIRQSIMVDQGG